MIPWQNIKYNFKNSLLGLPPLNSQKKRRDCETTIFSRIAFKGPKDVYYDLKRGNCKGPCEKPPAWPNLKHELLQK